MSHHMPLRTREKRHTMGQLKGNFHHKELWKGNLADNKWIGGRRELHSVTTVTFYLPGKYSWRGGGDGGLELAESKELAQAV